MVDERRATPTKITALALEFFEHVGDQPPDDWPGFDAEPTRDQLYTVHLTPLGNSPDSR